MPRAHLLLISIAFLLLLSGCVEQKSYEVSKSEVAISAEAHDLDSDGLDDYAVYGFAPQLHDEAGMRVTRQVGVAVVSSGAFTSIDPNLTDIDLLEADQKLEQFSDSWKASETECRQSLGLVGVVCSDIVTCSSLCSSNNVVKCRKIADDYEEALGGAIISFVQDNDRIRSGIFDARKDVLKMRGADESERAEFIDGLSDLIGYVALINTNPVYTNSALKLCAPSDFGASFIVEAIDAIGTYERTPQEYRYSVALQVAPTKEPGAGGVEVGGVGLTERLPSWIVSGSDVSSSSDITVLESGSEIVIEWESKRSSDDGYILYYEFTSQEPPEVVLASLKTPGLEVRRINLIALEATDWVYALVYGIGGNFYIALGTALGFSISVLLLLYNMAVLVFTTISERAAGFSFTRGFRKAFGRTDIRWKSDGVVALIALIAGSYVAMFFAVSPSSLPRLIETLEILLTDLAGMLAAWLVLVGVLMLYLAFENLAKLTILERAYGMVIREEKEAFAQKAERLKERLRDLAKLIEEYRVEEFDVGQEYDTLASISADKVDSLAKSMSARSRSIIDDDLNRVENAIGALKERKRTADSKWPEWKKMMDDLLADRNELYASSLNSVPSSLRLWAMGKYVKEAGAGVVLDRDAIKKRKVTAGKMVAGMMEAGLIKGAVTIKDEKLDMTDFGGHSETVLAALSFKMRGYLRTLGRNLGQREPNSLVAIGKDTVIVYLRNHHFQSVVFVKKDKFKEAMERWKAAIPALSADKEEEG